MIAFPGMPRSDDQRRSPTGGYFIGIPRPEWTECMSKVFATEAEAIAWLEAQPDPKPGVVIFDPHWDFQPDKPPAFIMVQS